MLFCVGGRGASGDPFKTVECYDPRKNRWFQVAEMNTRRRHVGVCSADGELQFLTLFWCGEIACVGTWRTYTHACMHTYMLVCTHTHTYTHTHTDTHAHVMHTCAHIHVRTHTYTHTHTNTIIDTLAHVMHTCTHTYMCARTHTYAHMHTHIDIHAHHIYTHTHKIIYQDTHLHDNTFIFPGMLYAVGGHDGNEHLNSGEVFNPKTNKWKPISPMGTLRQDAVSLQRYNTV